MTKQSDATTEPAEEAEEPVSFHSIGALARKLTEDVEMTRAAREAGQGGDEEADIQRWAAE